MLSRYCYHTCMENTEAIAEALRQRQRRLNESDGNFARRLQVSRQAWQQARTGDTLPGPPMLRGAARAFPELASHIMSLFLPDSASILDEECKEVSNVEASS